MESKKILNSKDFGQFNEYVSNFIKTLSSVYPKEYLKNLYIHINSLTIKKKHSLIFKAGGNYFPLTNTIKIIKYESIYHELMHMASTSPDRKRSGFKSGHFALDEGYTELLTARYFQNNMPTSYFLEVKIAKIVESIIGPIMTKLYFEADNLGLVNELKKLSSEKEILEFFNSFDYLSLLSDDIIHDRNVRQSKKMFKEYLKNVFNYLTKIYFMFLRTRLDEGKISEEEYYEMQNKFLDENELIRFSNEWWPTYSFDYVEELKQTLNTNGKNKI